MNDFKKKELKKIKIMLLSIGKYKDLKISIRTILATYVVVTGKCVRTNNSFVYMKQLDELNLDDHKWFIINATAEIDTMLHSKYGGIL